MDDLIDSLKSNACAAVNISIAKIYLTFSIILYNCRAEFAPILTWSSWPFEDVIESVLAGFANCLLILTILAAVYWGIINPEFNPESTVKKDGRFLAPDIKLNILLSDMFPNSASDIFRKSNIYARGWPWKFPPEMILLSFNDIIGLSVTEFISSVKTFDAYKIVSRVAPWTCGIHLNE